MADEEYYKKLKDLQRYVPFLENTIKRLKTESGKPREAQITKLQSLLVILTDTRKKLKYDALRKCEEVIFKLYEKVEKKPPGAEAMHKYMCRNPPEFTSRKPPSPTVENEVADFSVARQKLIKQIELTPASPSPPLDNIVLSNPVAPVVIPTEKIQTNTGDTFHPIRNNEYNHSSNFNNFTPVQSNLSLNWPPNCLNQYPISENQISPKPPKVWSNEPLFLRRNDLNLEPSTQNKIWSKKDNNFPNVTIPPRNLVDYSDNEIDLETNSPMSELKPKKSPIRITFPEKKPLKTKSSSTVVSLNKPPLSESDLQDLLSPKSSPESGEISPSVDSDMDLDKLEELKAKLYAELEENKKDPPSKNSPKSDKPAKIKSPRIIERVIKEQDNIFGNLLSSIDEQIISKNKENKKIDKEKPKNDKKDSKLSKKDDKSKRDKSKDRSKIDDKKLTTKQDILKLNEKVKSNYFKTDEKETSKGKDKDSKKQDSKTKTDKNESKTKADKDKECKTKDDKTKVNKSESKTKEDKTNSDKIESKEKTDKNEVKIKMEKDKSKIKTEKDDSKTKSDKFDSKIDKIKPNRRPSLIKDLESDEEPKTKKPETSTSRIKLTDKERAVLLGETGLLEEEEKTPTSGRLSDKYPHKRKPSIDAKPEEVIISPKSKPLTTEVHPLKLQDPRLKNHPLMSPPLPPNIPLPQFAIKDLPQSSFPVKNPAILDQFSQNLDQFSGNLGSRDQFLTNLGPQDRFASNLGPQDRFASNSARKELFGTNLAQFDQFSNLNMGNRTPGDPFLNLDENMGNRTPGDPFLGNRTPGDPFLGNRTPGDPFLGSQTPVDPFLGNQTPGDPFLGNQTPGDPFLGNQTQGDQFLGNYDTDMRNFNKNQFRGSNKFRGPQQDRFKSPLLSDPFMNPPNPNFTHQDSDFRQNQRHHNQRFSNRQNFQENRNNFQQDSPSSKYDLSKMNPIDFYDDNNKDRRASFENNSRSFRGRGNRGKFRNVQLVNPIPRDSQNENFFRKGRYDRYEDNSKDPRRFEDKNYRSRSEDNKDHRSRFEDKSEHRSRFEENKNDPRTSRWEKTEVRNRSESRFSEENRFSSEDKPNDPRIRTSEEITITTLPENKPEEKKVPKIEREVPKKHFTIYETIYDKKEEKPQIPKEPIKKKEETYSILDSLYSTETKQIGKGYGFQKFKIPKIRKSVEEIKKEEIIEVRDEIKPEIVESVPDVEEKIEEPEVEEIEEKEEIVEASTSKEEISDKSEHKSEADEKLDMFNKFMKHIFDTCDSSVLLQYLDKCGFSLPQAKTTKIRRIIDSSSESEEEETKEHETIKQEDKSETVEVPQTIESKTEEIPEKKEVPSEDESVIETVGERIKNRRRKQLIYSSDSSPEKTIACVEGSLVKTEKIGKKKTPRTKNKKPPKCRRKNALELLQEDLRDMFISEGVLTATGKRMCRVMKEHQDIMDSPEKKEPTLPTTNSDDDLPLVKRKNQRSTRSQKSLEKEPKLEPQEEIKKLPIRKTRSSPRVLLEKINFPVKSSSEDETELENEIKPVRRTRSSVIILEPEKELPVEEIQPEITEPPVLEPEVIIKPPASPRKKINRGKVNKKRLAARKRKLARKQDSKPEEIEDTELISTNKDLQIELESIETQITEFETEKAESDKKKPVKKKKTSNWAHGVIKRERPKRKMFKTADLSSVSDNLSEITENETDLAEIEPETAEDKPIEINEPKTVESEPKTVESEPKTVESEPKTIENEPKTVESLETVETESETTEIEPEVPETTKDDFGLLKIDLKPDVNYFIDNSNKFDCKLCEYSGKYIVYHYKSRHPESEIMISRLSPEQAELAQNESNINNFENIIAYEEVLRGKKRRTSFLCRFCGTSFQKEFSMRFFDHLTCHTGEFRYSCEACPFMTGNRKTYSQHCYNLHPHMKKPVQINPLYNSPPNFRLVFGYLCKACNFVQLLRPNLENHIKLSHPDESIDIIKISLSGKSVNLDDLKPVEPEEKKPEETPIKEPNITAFLEPDDISIREKLIEDERRKKMEEISNKITPRRSGLSFVEQLKNKLQNQFEQEDLEDDIEIDIENHPIEPLPDENIIETSKNEISPKKETLKITSTCSLAEIETETEKETSDLRVSDEDPEEETEEMDISGVDLNLLPDSRQKGVSDIIQRLAAKLQNPNNLSDCEESVKNDFTADNEEINMKTAEIPEINIKTELPSECDLEPVETEQNTNDDSDLVIDVGAIQLFLKNKKAEQYYVCKIPDCEFSSSYKISFTKHCSDSHIKLLVDCDICKTNGEQLRPFTMTSLFVHLHDKHKTNTKPVPKIENFAGKIRLRRISGDLLSKPTVEENQDLLEALNQPIIFKPEVPKPQESGFLQIQNVRTLTPEEEINLSAKSGDSTTNSQIVPKVTTVVFNSLPTSSATTSKKIMYPYQKVVSIKKNFTLKKQMIQHHEILCNNKARKVFSDMLKIPNILNLYKCPVETCSFSTNGKSNFTLHFKYHKWCQVTTCPYCTENVPPDNLLVHVDKYHAHCTFQCAHCFYRSITRNYLFVHQRSAHGIGQPAIFETYYMIKPLLPTFPDVDINLEQIAKNLAIMPYICRQNGCDKKILLMDDFLIHLNAFHQKQFECNICAEHKFKNVLFTTAQSLIKHYLMHSIGKYQCRFCLHATPEINMMFAHYAKKHQNLKAICFIRQLQNKNMTNATVNDMLAIDMESKVVLKDPTVAPQNPPENTPNPPPLVPYTQTETEETSNQSLPTDETKPEIELNIPERIDSSVIDLVEDNLDDEPLVTLKHRSVESKNAVENAIDPLSVENFENIEENVTFNEIVPTVPPEKSPVINEDEGSQNFIPPAELPTSLGIGPADLIGTDLFRCGNDNCFFRSQKLSDLKSHLFTCDIMCTDFKCVHCDLVFDSVVNLCEHIQIHGLRRFHCDLCQFKSALSTEIIKHMRDSHQVNYTKFYPFLPTAKDMTKDDFRVKPIQNPKDDELVTKNKINTVLGAENINLLPKQTEVPTKNISTIKNTVGADNLNLQIEVPTKNYVLVKSPVFGVQDTNLLPRQAEIPTKTIKNTVGAENINVLPKQAEVPTKIVKSLKINTILEPGEIVPTKTPSPIKSPRSSLVFGPEEINLLPRPLIFLEDVKCKICNFATKVRYNMQRHLQQHIDEKAVPDSAPINPVPCLEKNERMFDKMTNLAASSNSSRMGAKTTEKVDKNVKEDVGNYPGFIAINKRFVCGAENCNYLTHGETMLRHHLTALHADELIYKCPHCNINIPTEISGLEIDKILFHLKMHDLHLYKCQNCIFIHYQKHKMEKHINDNHPDGNKKIEVIRELDSSANLEDARPSLPANFLEQLSESQENNKSWRCGLCNFKSTSRGEIINHSSSAHNIKSQYKCALCQYKCSAKNNFAAHYKKNHPDEEIKMISVYFKTTEPEESTSSQDDFQETPQFDTTPLWVRNKNQVKHIRGILLEEQKSPSKRSPPKIIEKLAEIRSNSTEVKSIDDITKNLFNTAPEKEIKSLDVTVKYPSSYGTPEDNFYVCPVCETFKTKTVKDFIEHLSVEMNYFRCICDVCGTRFINISEAKLHWTEMHKSEGKDNKITPLTPVGKVENWIDCCVGYQHKKMKKVDENNPTENCAVENIICAPNVESLFENDFENDYIDDDEPLINIKEQNKPEVDSEKINSPPKLNCQHCTFIAKTNATLRKHEKRHYANHTIKCNYCPFGTFTVQSLTYHHRAKHKDEELSYTEILQPDGPVIRPLKRKRQQEPDTPPNKLIRDTSDDLETAGNSKIETEMPVLQPENAEEIAQLLESEVSREETDIIYVCLHCPRKSDSLEIIRTHFLTSHDNKKGAFKYKKVIIDKSKKSQYKCSYCDFQGYPDALKQHHLEMHSNRMWVCQKAYKFRCSICDKVIKTINTLKKHFHQEHSGRNLSYQTISETNEDDVVDTTEFYEESLDIKPLINKIKCDYCSDSFTTNEQLLRHHHLLHSHLELKNENLKGELKKFKCPQCGHSSNSYPAMRDHLRAHHKPFICTYCNLFFSYPNQVKSHHLKEHRNLTLEIIEDVETKKQMDILRKNMLHLQPDGSYTAQLRASKRSILDISEEPPKKVIILESSEKKNVAKKSTTLPAKFKNVAKKSTSNRPIEGFSFYGTKPCDITEYRNVMSEIQVMGKTVPVNVVAMSQIINLSPTILLVDYKKNPASHNL